MDFIYQNRFLILTGSVIIEAAVFGWLIFLLYKKIRKILGGMNSKESDLPQNIIQRMVRAEIKLEELEPRLRLVEDISKISVQKTGFLRFNPFQDTGGDNSFVLSFLDRDNNGVLISSLYTRDGVRVYAKSIEKGKSRHLLSDEEKKVLEETIAKKT